MKSLNVDQLQNLAGGDQAGFEDCMGTATGLAVASGLYGGLAGAAFGLIVVFGGGLLHCEAAHL